MALWQMTDCVTQCVDVEGRRIGLKHRRLARRRRRIAPCLCVAIAVTGLCILLPSSTILSAVDVDLSTDGTGSPPALPQPGDDARPFGWRALVSTALAGAVAEAARVLIPYPIETIKVMHQVRSYEGTDDKEEAWSFTRLYQGAPGATLGAAAIGGLYVPVYTLLKAVATGFLPAGYGTVGVAFAAACANMVSAIVEVPVDACRTLAMARKGQGFLQVLTSTVSRAGLSGLYAGLLPFMMKSMPQEVVEFVSWEWAMSNFEDFLGEGEVVTMMTGVFAGLVSTVVSHPFDTLKTTVLLANTAEPGSSIFAQVCSAVTEIRKSGGLRGFFAGLLPRLFKNVPDTAVYFYALNWTLLAFGKVLGA
eukprot:TRINITY_DN17989_c0_g1_i1.p1 TRINITY_DN17989_c0_g1~~TRINITY_DN17989_c0_g1_i1.p1  ORF type:complete len:363 (-),score=42.39 TRINITY_DN17989_c0_g1_i1:187-1275(-)